MFEQARARGHALAVVGIPKTIDNDVRDMSRGSGTDRDASGHLKLLDMGLFLNDLEGELWRAVLSCTGQAAVLVRGAA